VVVTGHCCHLAPRTTSRSQSQRKAEELLTRRLLGSALRSKPCPPDAPYGLCAHLFNVLSRAIEPRQVEFRKIGVIKGKVLKNTTGQRVARSDGSSRAWIGGDNPIKMRRGAF
ncbi:MAG: hypothetical protein ACR2PG_27110, partial [Hyphomicrobiaceae bacterium]